MKTSPNDLINPTEKVERWLTSESPSSGVCPVKVTTGGLTKREYFAAMAMNAMLLKDDGERSSDDHKSGRDKRQAEWVASAATRYADALIAEMNKEE